MDRAARLEWLSPDRIMKIYGGDKSPVGTRRLFVIGIGANGIDCLIKCKDIIENRYSENKTKLRFLGIGLKEQLDGAALHGSELKKGERLEIDPEEAIYPYLNTPDTLPEAAKPWFDEGLCNYTPAKPTYGLSKRQGARVALFHCFDKVLKLFGNAINDFSADKSPVEIIFTGNLGDAFFGGMVIDLAYIVKTMFASAKFSVTVDAYMLAADTALLQGIDGRNLAIFYANTIVTKSELDKFQYQKKKYSQKFAENYVFSCDKPPFRCCTINAAEETYEKTLENIALKIASECAPVFKSDDDAERLLSYNMLGDSTNHSFRYICGGIVAEEIPIGKIVSFLTLKLIVMNYNCLVKNSAGDIELGIIANKAAANDEFLAQKAGALPKFEYDETLNPLFSLKSIKNGTEATKKYVTERLEIIAELCKEGAEKFLDEVFGEIRDVCEQARFDNEKGPYYAAEILRKCMSELKTSMKSTAEMLGNSEDAVSCEERRLSAEFRSIHGTFGLFGSKSTEGYIERIKKYVEVKRAQLTGQTLLGYYNRLYDKLDEYYKGEISEMTDLFSAAIDRFHNITEQMKPSEGGYLCDAFDASDGMVVAYLNTLAESLPESTTSHIFKRSKLLKECVSDDPRGFAREAVMYTAVCFNKMLSQSFDEFCVQFGMERSAVAALEGCLGRINTATPAEDETPLIRMVCPKDVKAGSVAGLRAAHSNITNLWSDSALLHTVIVEQVKGSVKLDEFKDYKQWENMRYAYVNDSLKKHGIHIFK